MQQRQPAAMHNGMPPRHAPGAPLRAPGEARRTTTLFHVGAAAHENPGDTALREFLATAWRKLATTSHRPPRCPRCAARGAAYECDDAAGWPVFHCGACRQRFNRLTGTPLARLRLDEKALPFFGLLSQPVSAAEAGRRLLVKADTVRHWAIQTRLWLLALDPRGDWERRVQLGVRYAVLPSNPRDESGPVTQGCRCVPANELCENVPGADGAPVLVRVCPVCEQRHVFSQ